MNNSQPVLILGASNIQEPPEVEEDTNNLREIFEDDKVDEHLTHTLGTTIQSSRTRLTPPRY